MDLTKCRTSSRLKSALFLVEAATGKVLKVWYEPDWDPLTTKVISYILHINVLTFRSRSYFIIILGFTGGRNYSLSTKPAFLLTISAWDSVVH